MKNIIRLLRPKHWIKNLLIFIPAFFSGNLWNAKMIGNLIISFLSFSLVSSVVYIVNDIKDLEKDRQHEVKCTRPLASGAVSTKDAGITALVLGISAIALNGMIKCSHPAVPIFWCVFYGGLNLAYSAGLKNLPLVDVAILSAGFMIRIFYGAAASDVTASSWLSLTVMSFALYMALGKRRNELYQVGGSMTRKVLAYYDMQLLDKYMMIASTLGIIFYSLWAGMVIDSQWMIWTVPLVLFIIMKYEMILKENSYGDPVEVLLSDHGLCCLALLYTGMMFVIMYGGGT